MERSDIMKGLAANPVVKRSSIIYQHMRDPALLRYYYKVKTQAMASKLDMAGSSPADIFIGRFGYPYVNIGPLVPPEFGDTSMLGTPEQWWGKSIEDIVDFRSKLVRGMHLTKITDVEKGKVQEQVRDLALAEKSTDAEMSFEKRLFVKLDFRDEVQPFGPSAQMKGFEVYNPRADRRLEKKYFDTDAKATTAIMELYNTGMNVSRIQRGLSAGLFGLKNNRKFVPTRWSITAVDDTIGKANREEVKGMEHIDAIHAYYNVALDNRWMVFLMPGNWEYESLEAFFPGTVWNEDGKNVSIFGDYEGYHGRSKYAEMGGCYYSGRLATTEKLLKLKRQAVVLILREAHPGYTMPVGVWNVREHLRETLATEPTILHSTNEMFSFIEGKMQIRRRDWVSNSRILKDLTTQKRLNSYLN
jgi:hypothetical protein